MSLSFWAIFFTFMVNFECLTFKSHLTSNPIFLSILAMKQSMNNTLPLVNLELIKPLIAALREQGIDPEAVLETVGLTMDGVEQEGATVHVMVVHQFVENCAQAANDPTFCAKVGARLDHSGWPMIQQALKQARTLGDFLNFYVVGASKVASSAIPFLEVRGDAAIFGEARRFEPQIEPAQNDAFMISLKLAILKNALGSRLDPQKILLVLCAPDALPSEYARYQKLAGDRMGPRIRFPTEWLLTSIGDLPVDKEANSSLDRKIDHDFLRGFRRLLRQNTGNGRLKVAKAAELVQMKPKSLGRRLALLGTSISKEIADAKIAYSKEALATTNRTIEDIATSLGYSEPSNFTRAFTKQEGKSPTEFRNLEAE